MIGVCDEELQSTELAHIMATPEVKVFYRIGGRYYNRKNCTAEFSSRGEAIEAGSRLCGIWDP